MQICLHFERNITQNPLPISLSSCEPYHRHPLSKSLSLCLSRRCHCYSLSLSLARSLTLSLSVICSKRPGVRLTEKLRCQPPLPLQADPMFAKLRSFVTSHFRHYQTGYHQQPPPSPNHHLSFVFGQFKL